MDSVAHDEGLDAEDLRLRVSSGRVVIPANPAHQGLRPVGIGAGLRTKVNANIGTSPDLCDSALEMAKLRAALEAGADTVMDLSTGGDLAAIRAMVLRECSAPVGTVPIYEAAAEALAKGADSPADFTDDALFAVIARHAEQGVDFVTVHCGVTRQALDLLRRQGRRMGIVSRGGSFLAARILRSGYENPLYSRFDDLIDIARAHDVTLSLGDGLRPGCIADAGDRAQTEELVTLGELVRRARDAGVQVMVEGPGHVPMSQVRSHVELQRTVCDESPFYVLGPIVTDIAPGYDHIAGAIGGALAAWAGASFLCYVTPAEHLGLPTAEHVRTGVIASRIAAHAADVARGLEGARARDDAMAGARWKLDWDRQAELALDPDVVKAWRRQRMEEGGPECEKDTCSMCGRFCAVRVSAEALGL
jgi:phosphomethylpyrimidine synthase